MLWLITANFALPSVATVIVSGILVGIYWAYSTTLAAGVVDEVTDGGGFTVGHNQQIGIWFFGRLAPKFAGKKKIDCEDMELPGWLAIFNNNVTSVAILMFVFCGLFCIPLGISGIEELFRRTELVCVPDDGGHSVLYVYGNSASGRTDALL